MAAGEVAVELVPGSGQRSPRPLPGAGSWQECGSCRRLAHEGLLPRGWRPTGSAGAGGAREADLPRVPSGRRLPRPCAVHARDVRSVGSDVGAGPSTGVRRTIGVVHRGVEHNVTFG
jgi:hypothetical protein